MASTGDSNSAALSFSDLSSRSISSFTRLVTCLIGTVCELSFSFTNLRCAHC
jgi:hypothetical protein